MPFQDGGGIYENEICGNRAFGCGCGQGAKAGIQGSIRIRNLIVALDNGLPPEWDPRSYCTTLRKTIMKQAI